MTEVDTLKATIEALTKRVEELEARLAPGEQFHSTGEYTKPPPIEPDTVTVLAKLVPGATMSAHNPRAAGETGKVQVQVLTITSEAEAKRLFGGHWRAPPGMFE